MLLEIDIHKKLREFPLDISIHSDSRRIGILGGSGGGKSVTLKCIAGIMTPDSGTIEIGGRLLYHSGEKARRFGRGGSYVNIKPQERHIGYLFQNYALFPTMTVQENICAGLRGSKEQKQKKAMEMIRKFRLEGLESRYPGKLSGGQQQRVALARLLACTPDVILLDEPFSAMDAYLKDQLQQQMADMLEDYPGVMILVSHNRDEVYRFCDTLLVVNDGQAVRFGETKNVFRDPEKRIAARLTGCKNFTDLVRRDAHHAHLVDWGIDIYTKREIPEETRYLGYRAHDFIPVWNADRESFGLRDMAGVPENAFRIHVEEQVEMPFERNYYLRPTGEKQSYNPAFISWFVQEKYWKELDEKGMPDFLRLDESQMLFLT